MSLHRVQATLLYNRMKELGINGQLKYAQGWYLHVPGKHTPQSWNGDTPIPEELGYPLGRFPHCIKALEGK